LFYISKKRNLRRFSKNFSEDVEKEKEHNEASDHNCNASNVAGDRLQ
jgi:hypothetical protein